VLDLESRSLLREWSRLMRHEEIAHCPMRREPPLLEHSLGAELRLAARDHAERVALLWRGDAGIESLGYAQLASEAERWAQWLLRSGAKRGDAVAALTPTCLETVFLTYAAALAGVRLMPVNPAFRDPELLHLLDRAGADVLVAAHEYRGESLQARSEKLGERARKRPRVLRMADAQGFSALCELPDVHAGDPYLLLPTSGTTGRSKIAVLDHRAVLNHIRTGAIALQPGDDEVWFATMPFFHIGYFFMLFAPMMLRGASVFSTPLDPLASLELMRSTRTTVTSGVPTMLYDLIHSPAFDGSAVQSVRVVIGGGAKFSPQLVTRIEIAFGARMIVGYGQSEAPLISQTRLDDSPEDKARSIGRPLPHREVQIVDPETGRPCRFGEVGELWTRGPLTMEGYLGDPEETARTRDREGWVHTGDLCRMDERRVLYFVDRARDVVIRGGENIYPAEVEAVLESHPDVSRAAVIGVPDERLGELVKACVELREGVRPSEKSLAAHCAERLAYFKVPVLWDFVHALPLTETGKIRKIELRH
jgi:fatty-acyl-CoA synthase